jgi:hypothetical protein
MVILVTLMIGTVRPINASSVNADSTYFATIEGFSFTIDFDEMDHGSAVMAKIVRLKNSHVVNVSMFLRKSERAIINLGLYYRENDMPLTNLGLLLIQNEKYLTIEAGHIMSDDKFVKIRLEI